MDSKTVKTLAVVALVVAVGGLTMGYAALTQTLQINASATVQSQATTWNIKFANPGTPVKTGHAVAGNVELGADSTSVTFTGTTFKTQNDSVSVEFDIVNSGQVDATLTTVTPAAGTATGTGDSADADAALVNNNYTYSLVYVDTNQEVAINDTLTAGQTRRVKLTITFTGGADETKLPTNAVTINGLGYTLVYNG